MNLTQATLSANGASSSDEQSGSGGGAGGSIFLSMNSLIAQGTVSAVGGRASLSGGGGGSGGRIKFYFFGWYLADSNKNMQDTNGLQILTTGGIGGSEKQMGENGTVWSTPCAPGYYGLFCTPCKNGTYKTEYSNVECKKCESMPLDANGYYVVKGNFECCKQTFR